MGKNGNMESFSQKSKSLEEEWQKLFEIFCFCVGGSVLEGVWNPLPKKEVVPFLKLQSIF